MGEARSAKIKGTRTQTLKFRFLYVTDSTLNPIVGIVVTTSPIYTRISIRPHVPPLVKWRWQTFSL
jgi:hypothetical protein